MGILAAKRFKENYKASGGPYKGQGYREIANNKINFLMNKYGDKYVSKNKKTKKDEWFSRTLL